MTDDIINQIINDSETVVVEKAPIEAASPESIDTKIEEPEKESSPDQQDDPPFSKKVRNAFSYRDKKIGRLQAERAALTQELQGYRDKAPKAADNAPKAEDYDDYGKFLKAEILHELNQGKQQETKQQESAQSLEQTRAWATERMSYVAEQERAIATTLPDYQQVVNENAEALRNLPEHLQLALLETENPHLAFYALAKEGRLYDLADMSERQAMMLIGKAEARGSTMATRKISKAPTPIDGLRGTGKSTKSLSDMNADDVMDWYNNKR